MNLKIKPYDDLSENEKIKYYEVGKRIVEMKLTEVQYYRGELARIEEELFIFIKRLLMVDEEIDEPDFMWTDEQYQEIVEKYRDKVKKINKLFNDK